MYFSFQALTGLAQRNTSVSLALGGPFVEGFVVRKNAYVYLGTKLPKAYVSLHLILKF